ncbi:MAG: methyltransferase domain-containing protein [Planctomycetaceae bacterium]|nr:methyltransferase domain-containing protein [Planctomycetaceae bacterium]
MMTDCDLTGDLNRTKTFEETLQQVIRQGGLCLMISLGHRTGLFDVMGNMDCATSQEIAARSGLQERYVGDWLAAMAHGDVIEYDEMFKTYRLPSERAALLTRAAGLKNYASHLQWFSIFGKMEDDLVRCFREGAGVPESVFADLQSNLTAEKSESDTNRLFKHVLPAVPTLIMRLCEGLDVLDLGCGSGATLLELATAFPQSRFVGYDDCAEQIQQARRTAEERGIENVAFFNRGLAQIHAIDAFDLITAFDVLHTQAYPFLVLDEAYAALRPGGIFLLQDIAESYHTERNLKQPFAPLLYAISCLRSMAQQNETSADSVSWGQEPLCQTLEAVGFEQIDVLTVPHDLLHSFYLARKPVTSAR